MEQWRDIVGLNGAYQVSDLGRVRRSKPGRGATSGRVLSLVIKQGYSTVRLYLGAKDRWRQAGVHRLVAEAFIGPCPPDKSQVNHLDGNRSNNVPSNLEWVTSLENQLHAIAHLNRNASLPRGTEHHNSVLTESQVREIKSLYRKGSREHGTNSLALAFGVSQRSIWNILSGRTWGHIT